MNMLNTICAIVLATAASLAVAAEPAKEIRIGIIGLDTSHSPEFTKLLNDPKAASDLAGVRVVAAFPGGSHDIPHTFGEIPKFTKQLRGMGVEIVGSIDELLKHVDAVMLESVDGRPHLEQARPVIAAGKPLYVDKPMAVSLADAMEIFRLADAKHVPCFSASSLRYIPGFQSVRNKTSPFGDIRRCTAWSPLNIEPHHPDLFWYGIYGVESLYTIMGPGCKTVTRVAPDKVVGVWADGREGTFVATPKGKPAYGAEVEGSRRSGVAGTFEGYRPLVVEIVKFFKTGKPPVDAAETLEILAFMEAADQSKQQGGKPVTIESVMKKARESLAK